jgi:hypothetical protein
MDDLLICSMHIQKTAGLSLLAAMRQHYTEEGAVLTGLDAEERGRLRALAQQEPEVARRVRVVHGHMPWGFHDWFGGRPHVYIGFVREPVERVVSYYHFCRREPTHDCHALANRVDLEEWVELNPHLCCDNAMTRYFAGRITDMAPRPVAITDRKAVLDEARRNIVFDFPVVGVVERMGKSLFMLEQFFGWDRHGQAAPVMNVNPHGPSLHAVPQRLRDRIADLNRLDLELYDFCVFRLERDAPGLGWRS